MSDIKICSTCKVEKELTEFYKKLNTLSSYCKVCQSIYLKNYRLINKEVLKEKSKIARLKYDKEIKKKYHKEYQKEYYKKNKEKINIKNTNYRLNNISEQRLRVTNWYKKNKEKVYIYQSNRKLIDPLFKLSCDIRTLIGMCIRKKGYSKKSKTYQILGCSYEEFKQYIERQFTKGMTWENRQEWHLDHIYPVSLAKDEEELIRLNHYTNFQPLWAKENIQKSNKITDNKQLKLI